MTAFDRHAEAATQRPTQRRARLALVLLAVLAVAQVESQALA